MLSMRQTCHKELNSECFLFTVEMIHLAWHTLIVGMHGMIPAYTNIIVHLVCGDDESDEG